MATLQEGERRGGREGPLPIPDEEFAPLKSRETVHCSCTRTSAACSSRPLVFTCFFSRRSTPLFVPPVFPLFFFFSARNYVENKLTQRPLSGRGSHASLARKR